ncbi:MAG TPA: MFS transporter [Nocardioidaceae bacterium]|nr:MFS transporter [Nocardioidaceae bacterium]
MTDADNAGPAPVPADTVEPDAKVSRARRLAFSAMLFAVAMTFIDQTIVAIATPSIQSELSLSRSGTQWVVNAYLLALAATFALGGRLADILGQRRMVLIGIVGFAVTSALCGATPTGSAAETWIIIFRALQGVSGAIMIPAALAVVVAIFPIRERGKALAIFFGVSGAMTSIGPIAGGYLTQWTWRSIFWINVPVAIVALVLTLMAGLEDKRRRDPIDIPGAILIAAGMGLSVLGFQQAQTWGWDNPLTWLCIVGGLVVLVVFARFEARNAHPLVRVQIFRDRAFLVDNGVLFFSMIAFIPVFFFASVYSQVSLGYDGNQAGLYLFVFFGGFAPASQISGRMLDKGGAKRPMLIGSVLACVGFALWASKLDDLSLSSQWVYIVMAGAGIGFLVGPSSTDAVNRAINASYGEVTGITQTVRNYGSSLGFAVLGTLLTTRLSNELTSSLVGLGVPERQAESIGHRAATGSVGSSSFSRAPESIRSQLEKAVQVDFAHATAAVLYGMAIALGVCFLIALRHPGGKVEDHEEATASDG